MLLIIRKVDKRPFWDRNAPPVESWLKPEDLAADALQEIRTTENRLSVYLIDSLESPGLNRLLAALAACRDFIANLVYAALDAHLLNDLQIRLEETPGETPDEEVNKWHRDLIELTASKLSDFGLAIRKHAKISRKHPKDIKELIKQGIRSNQIEQARLKQNLANEIK